MIQADDLTGAADTAVAFAVAGERTVVVPWSAAGDLGTRLDGVVRALEPRCLAIDTGSRELERADAARRAGAVAGWVARRGHGSLYKKVDSVLRGHPGAELAAVLGALDHRRPVVVAPAYPELGRATVGARQLVDGRPVVDGDLLARLELDPKRTRAVSLDELRAGLTLGGGDAFVIVDAALAGDLDLLAEALERLAAPPLLVGSGGLAAALAARGRGTSAPEQAADRPGGRRLVVSVSRAAAAAAQVERLRELLPELVDGRLALAAVTGDERARRRDVERSTALVRAALAGGGDALLGARGEVVAGLAADDVRRRINRSLEEVVAAALEAEPPELVVAGGGDSAHAICAALGIEALVVERALPAGAVESTTHGRPDPPLRLVTKSGGFGGVDALAELCGALVREPAGSGGR